MIESISAYIKNVAILLVFITFIGIILPSGKYKNYIDLVLGLVLIVVMLKPALNIFSKGNGIDIPREFYKNAVGDYTMSDYENIHNDMVDKSFNSLLKQQADSLITPHNYKVSELDIRYDQLSYEIYNMHLYIYKTDNKKTGLIEIEPVTIRLPSANKENEENSDPEIKNIKNIISDFYNVPVDNIYITVQKKNERMDTRE